MKKSNKLMRASSILLVLTLATSCFVGGTFAKYVTEETATDSARVAKWGVDVTVRGDAFKTDYNRDDPGVTPTTTVSSSTTDNVVAPGTNGSLGGVDIQGTPEVAVGVKVVSQFELTGDWTVGSNEFYCPIVIDIDGDQYCGLGYDSASAFKTDVDDAITTKLDKEYAAKTDLGAVEASTCEIKWRWVFDKDDTEDTTGFELDPAIVSLIKDNQTDAKDTALGDKADGGEELKITLGLETSVTQLD